VRTEVGLNPLGEAALGSTPLEEYSTKQLKYPGSKLGHAFTTPAVEAA
jgi:hypothetical protein